MSHITQAISEEAFRRDRDAVKALNEFLGSIHGQKFAAALRGGSVINHLATPENQVPRCIRDIAMAEAPNPSSLLGVSKGYQLAMNFIDRLCEAIDPDRPKPVSQRQKVLQTMRKQPDEG